MAVTSSAKSPGSVDAEAPRLLRSALYLDFDNVYSGLQRVDKEAAKTFADDPGLLLDWLSQGEDDDGRFRRRFLVRDCYLNPQEYAWCRAQFVAAGFRVIDCPSLTQQGKSSADTHIVLDVVAALGHPTRYDEFVICSADADFSPLMTKLRRHDRRTVMIAAGPFATAYEAVCDTTFGSMQLLEAFTPDRAVTAPPAEAAAIAPADLAAAAVAVRDAVAAAPAPIPGSSAALAALRVAPGIAAAGWGGAGGFSAFVGRELPVLTLVRHLSGGWLLDPTRHTSADIPTSSASPDDVVARVCRVTRAPRLSSRDYAVLFTELAEAVTAHPALNGLGPEVRDRAAAQGASVGRKSVNAVVSALVYRGADPRESRLSPRQLAESWRDNLAVLCRQAGMQLSASDEKALDTWILSSLPLTS